MRRLLLVLVVVAVAGGVVWWQRERSREASTPRLESSPSPTTASESPRSPSDEIELLDDTKGLVALGIGDGGRSAIALVDAESGEQRYELPLPGEGATPVAWSPSGRSLVYLLRQTSGDIYRVALFGDGRDVLLGPAASFVARPVWADEERLFAVGAESLVEVRTDGGESRRGHARDLGVCVDGECPRITDVAVHADGTVAVTTDAGHLAVLREGIGSQPETSRSPDEVRCFDPHFRGERTRLGVTCVVIPPDYDQSSDDPERNHYDFNAWVVDLSGQRWVQVRTESGGHEWGAKFFPWSPDGSRYVVETYSEDPCSPSFSLADGTGKRVSRVVEGTFGSFSADGASIVFDGGLPQECPSAGIYVADVSLSELKRITTVGSDPLWSPAR